MKNFKKKEFGDFARGRKPLKKNPPRGYIYPAQIYAKKKLLESAQKLI
jgi:hypothetical protein